jgi:choline-sulfatase
VRALFCALLLILAACSRGSSPTVPVAHDLVAALPAAELHREVGTIDFGTPAARPFLISGWHQNEGGGRQGPTVVWSQGERSVLDLWLAAPRALRAVIRWAPFDPADGRPQVVTITLNGRRIGSLPLRPRLNEAAIDLPRAAQVAGTNRLEFSYRSVADGRRRLAVSWDLLRLVPGSAPGLPRAEARPGRDPALLLPFGTEAAFHFALEDGGTLSLQGVRGQGKGGGALQVIAREEGGREEVLETLAAGTGPRSIELPGRGARLLRLGLRAVPGPAGAEGGFLLLAPAVQGRAAAPAPQASSPRSLPRPNVIVYLVDTLRADRVGSSREGTPVTPEIDAFSRGATVFENAFAQAPWTKPSVTSIFTGLGPLAHGVRKMHDKLPPEAVTVAELLHAAGYQTAGFSTNWHVSHDTGLDQGFGTFDFSPQATASDLLHRRVVRWLDGHGKDDPPFFLYIHALDPHGPYTPPVEYRRRLAPGARTDAGTGPELRRIFRANSTVRGRLIAELPPLYDAEVAFNDHSFGALLAALRERGLYDSSLIVFVSDHGEEFDEHGDFGHGNNLFDETLHVPLIVKWPGQRRHQEVRAPAQHVDLLPTLLRTAGLQPPKGLPGLDLALVAAADGDPEALSGRAIVSHISRDGRDGLSVVQAGWKLIYPLTRDLAETSLLYHRATDPAEHTNRLADVPVRAGWLESLIRLEQARSRGGREAQTYEMDEETRRGLEALGYL